MRCSGLILGPTAQQPVIWKENIQEAEGRLSVHPIRSLFQGL